MSSKPVEQLSQVIVRFAGDSGDGMQLTGSQFTSETALLGNDISTLPDFPAEIRAPAGSLPGVSGFQLHFADHDILTPGDAPNVLVAMNPAALKTNIKDLPKGGTLIVERGRVQRAQPAEGGLRGEPARGRLARRVPGARGAADDADGRRAEGRRGRDVARGGALEEHVRARADVVAVRAAGRRDGRVPEREVRAKRPEIAEANIKALHAGYAFGETTETFAVTYEVKPAKLAPGTYRNITGNQALSYGLIAASKLSGLPLFLGAYPITPASRDPRGARGLQAVRRADVPGRGRDRRRGCSGRRGVRRRARRDDVGGPGCAASTPSSLGENSGVLRSRTSTTTSSVAFFSSPLEICSTQTPAITSRAIPSSTRWSTSTPAAPMTQPLPLLYWPQLETPTAPPTTTGSASSPRTTSEPRTISRSTLACAGSTSAP